MLPIVLNPHLYEYVDSTKIMYICWKGGIANIGLKNDHPKDIIGSHHGRLEAAHWYQRHGKAAPLTIPPVKLAPDLGILGPFWSGYDAIKHHVWCCHPIQTAFHILIRHLQSIWAHLYAVHT